MVIAIIAILAATLSPALAKAKIRTQGIWCLSNMKQLQLASIIYSADNSDRLPGIDGAPTASIIGVAPGILNRLAGAMAGKGNGANPSGAETNIFLLGVLGDTDPSGCGMALVGSIGGIAKAAGVYRCPADKSIDPASKQPRVRSVCANCHMGASDVEPNDNRNYRVFMETADFNSRLGSSDATIYMDENQTTINDGFLLGNPDPNSVGNNDRPALNHGNFSSISFADGHCQVHKWSNTYLTGSGFSNSDNQWFSTHITYLLAR